MGKPGSGMSSALYASTARLRGRAERGARPTLGRAGVAILAEVPLFAGLSRRHLRRIAGLAEEVRFAAGRTVVQYDSRGNAFYVIVDGRARVMTGYSSRAFARLGPGDFFGELALLDGGPRTATVVAETPLETIRILRADFRRMLKDEPEVSLKLLEELSRRLRTQRSASD